MPSNELNSRHDRRKTPCLTRIQRDSTSSHCRLRRGCARACAAGVCIGAGARARRVLAAPQRPQHHHRRRQLQLRRCGVRSGGAHRRSQRQDQHDGVFVHAGVQPGWAIGQRRCDGADDRRSRRRPVSGGTCGGRPVRTRGSAIPCGGEPLWGAGDDAAGVRVVSATDHRRRQPHGRAAARPVRSDKADQPGHQSLVAQAGGRHLAHKRQVGARGDGRRLVLHRQHRLPRRAHAGAGSDCRDAGPRHLPVHAQHVAGGGRQLLHRRPTTIGGKQNLDLQRNSRIGATFSRALDRHQAIRMSVSRGAYTTIGADFTSIAVGYNYAWAR